MQAALCKADPVENRGNVKAALRAFLAVLHPDKNRSAGVNEKANIEWEAACTKVSADLNNVYALYKGD